jgi:eukaryotic-like serine/threonine-protein kinase
MAERAPDRPAFASVGTPTSTHAVARQEVETEPHGVAGVQRRANASGVVGQLFDGYVTDGVLAEGGMGVLYEATHPVLGSQAVVKVLKKPFLADKISERRVLTEGQTLAALVHRNVVRVFGFGRLSDGRPWLLMERLIGESLFSMLKAQGPLRLDEALPLMVQMAAGLEATHGQGVVHRDLKPDNLYVVIDPDGERLIKLIDFGIARPDTTGSPESTDLRTATGQFLGTVAYGAPELFRGLPCSSASDVYGLGCVFFEMLAGRRPFTARGLQELAQQHLEAQPPALPRSVPRPVDALIARMLAKDPLQRPPIGEVRRALLNAQLTRTARAPAWVWWTLGTLGVLCAGLALALIFG